MGLFKKSKNNSSTGENSNKYNLAGANISVISFFKSIKDFEKGNQVGYDDGLLVFPANIAQDVLNLAAGNPRIIEQLLDFPNKYLGETPIIIGVPKKYMNNLRIPSGNEQIYIDLEDHWIPGGIRTTGVPEAIIDPVRWNDVFFQNI
ncbi:MULTISPECIES: hypothetical protein [unclassified Enterococcus]|uniref:hypothetical protein n=1 Tax=unclassified Enterococcus TaxID=2608891 RepID=UPI001556E88A|nr:MULTISPECIES: hypothetical protein [unclassified Enterococcus]MBS7577976.1 hypothetical protein [Enterococcus sp. MMGLQ5-2]MBS7585163.1 hypothetical protein [Enterococcus sp. MMGLQ5-1]NPD13020.1 hypothetical protein [Enterococcus sp. MMGLQ5-1]NPD37806.1 hypothetical protein [Enterococcus sp. MMGLQ5-2]